jgi:hypothetical protein
VVADVDRDDLLVLDQEFDGDPVGPGITLGQGDTLHDAAEGEQEKKTCICPAGKSF